MRIIWLKKGILYTRNTGPSLQWPHASFYTHISACRREEQRSCLLSVCPAWGFRKCSEIVSECILRMLRVFENRVLRRVFGPKRDEVNREWRKLHNKELSDLYSLPNIVRVVKSRRMRWVGHVACMGEGRGVHRVLVGKPEGKRPLGRPRRRWEDNIKMDLQEVGGSFGDWMELAEDRDRWRALVGTVRNLRVSKIWGIS